jgi:N-acylglucosamine 2-epimerase (GlcNAc 2-epimerase)
MSDRRKRVHVRFAYFENREDASWQLAEQLIRVFAVRTGLCAQGDTERRYLWTDAFAVLALLGLYHRTGAREYLDWTLRLVDLVHHVLGRHRRDDPRSSWISGLSDSEGERRPTAGGLRIGKPLLERGPGEPYDEQLEWDRDGQYFHYLTKWMHALNRVTVTTGDPQYNDWAIDLAMAAHRGFVYLARPSGPKRMCWKMSTDLTRPLVRSMGQLDPLDGFVAFSHLQATQRGQTSGPTELEDAVVDMRCMCEDIDSWATTDPLGIGGLLAEAAGLVRLIASGDRDFDDLLGRLLMDAARSLEMYASGRELDMPSESRLAFRELGLSIGLRSLDPIRVAMEQRPERFGGTRTATALLTQLHSLARFAPLVERIEGSWVAPAARTNAAWTAHLDINSVMLATSLVPEVYLLTENLEPPGQSACSFEPLSKDIPS